MSAGLSERLSIQTRVIPFAAFAAVCVLAAPPVRAHQGIDAAIGKALFKRTWVPAPSSTRANDGLGPFFNARSCAQCHHAATTGTVAVDQHGNLKDTGSVVRLYDAQGRSDPAYGAQIQTRAIAQLTPEARVRIEWQSTSKELADGTVIHLRKPEIALDRLGYGQFDPQTEIALSIAPSLSAAAQIARIDVASLEKPMQQGYRPMDRLGTPLLFGRKMTDHNIETAIALAFHRDLGMSTPSFPDPAGDCTAVETQCRIAPNGGDTAGIEIAAEIVTALTDYIRSLPPPSGPDQTNETGRAIFESAGCSTCHTSSQKSREGDAVMIFSDLALHDMGGEMAGIAEPMGRGARVWRTASLIGLKERLTAGVTLLHDGRARTVSEAILWHGGEAAPSAEHYAKLPADSRAALEQFLLGR